MPFDFFQSYVYMKCPTPLTEWKSDKNTIQSTTVNGKYIIQAKLFNQNNKNN